MPEGASRVVARRDSRGRLELACEGDPPDHGAAVDFRSLVLRGVGRLTLVRACGAGGSVFDATAGLGSDTWLLAAAGFKVTATERSSLVASVLRDGLERAARERALAAIAGRIELLDGDARDLLRSGRHPASAVYLDPMYPAKDSPALAAKAIRLVRASVGDDLDARDLFDAAANASPGRIVVKRPHHAPPVVDQPDLVMKSKLVRYDIYLRQGKSMGVAAQRSGK